MGEVTSPREFPTDSLPAKKVLAGLEELIQGQRVGENSGENRNREEKRRRKDRDNLRRRAEHCKRSAKKRQGGLEERGKVQGEGWGDGTFPTRNGYLLLMVVRSQASFKKSEGGGGRPREGHTEGKRKNRDYRLLLQRGETPFPDDLIRGIAYLGIEVGGTGRKNIRREKG